MKLSGFKTYLDLKKQHYKCRHCPRTFTLETSLVESNCYLSTPLKQAIFLEASHKKSESDIARELNKTRIRFMNQNKEFYNQFKHDWRPLLKAQDDINSTHCFYSKCYTNVVLEGVNNKIKIIKRIAFGYRSFYHFKARILIIHKYMFEQKNKRNQTARRAA